MSHSIATKAAVLHVARIIGASKVALLAADVHTLAGVYSLITVQNALRQLREEGAATSTRAGPFHKFSLTDFGKAEYLARKPSLIDDTMRKRIQATSEHT